MPESRILEISSNNATSSNTNNDCRLQLEDGATVAVIGGGPAGSFTGYFLVDFAERMGLEIEVDIYEPRDFSQPGPASCNHCGGIVSESLVQILAADGISLPTTVVQRGIDSYVLHMDVGSARIDTPLHEKRIAAVHRGAGPRGVEKSKWRSFDGFLQNLASERGARFVKERVDKICRIDGRLQVETQMGLPRMYDLLVGAVGVNTNALKLFEGLGIRYKRPQTTRTYICELPLGEEAVQNCLGSSMHIFLLDTPRLEFAALIPKGEFATVCLLGKDIDKKLVTDFLSSPETRRCLPPNWEVPNSLCHCSPLINVSAAENPFADRVVLVGDCGTTRLYKDGIGAAYRTAKAAATTAIFEGIGHRDFREHYWPAYRGLVRDNRIGKLVFAITRQIQTRGLGRRTILQMVTSEWRKKDSLPRMSTALWDTFTGSASYREILVSMVHPVFIATFLWHAAVACTRRCVAMARRLLPPRGSQMELSSRD